MKVDIIGDVHGCIDELYELFNSLGYQWNNSLPVHPDGRVPVFLGDLTDRGPDSLAVIELVYSLVMETKQGHYIPGNHCNKLYRYFLGNPVKEQHGLETTVAEYKTLNPKQQRHIHYKFKSLYEKAPLYLELPGLHTVVAHAGIKENMIGKLDKKVRTFVLYGDITGEYHNDGRPVRRDWAQSYKGGRWIVYGHTPVKKPRRVSKTINIDTGCVFGNALTAFRLPENKTVSVPSHQSFVPEKFRYFE